MPTKQRTVKRNQKKVFSRYGKDKIVIGQTFGKSMTVQDQKDACDINIILRKGLSSVPLNPTAPRRTPMFDDFTNGCDYEEAQIRIANMNSDFMSLPSHMREAFDNDPAKLIDALTDESQKDKLIELGVFDKIEALKSDAQLIGEEVAKAIKGNQEETPPNE